MKKKMICAVSAVMLLTLAGCGLKGPLYFPPEEPAAKPAAEQSAVQTDNAETGKTQK
ncbi:lipoprotein [Morganella morganii]|uniref:LPS translocon maturation chaperone LptM n=1 Tax=Morganella morganii TaxID=582 RepID=UPI00164C6F18|nr:lipoprotein [Morganella morganii]MBC4010721.1 lipoprotein [Morganella morganii]MCF1266006.1 lipoprotein [Morganella morganii]